jgi:hypothetical protein
VNILKITKKNLKKIKKMSEYFSSNLENLEDFQTIEEDMSNIKRKSNKRKAEDVLPYQPPRKRLKLLRYSVDDKTIIYHEETDDKIKVVEADSSKNLFVCIYDEGWKHYKKDVEGIKKKVQSSGEFWPVKKENFQIDEFIKRLEDWKREKVDVDVQKVIVYYVGHGKCVNNEIYPSFKNGIGEHVNTKEVHERIRKTKSFQLVVFIADCCSSIASKSSEEDVELHKKKEFKVNYFDFQGHYYIRSCQYGTKAFGNDKFGSFFCFCFLNRWDGNWIELIKDSNQVLSKFQNPGGIGKPVRVFNRKLQKNFKIEK